MNDSFRYEPVETDEGSVLQAALPKRVPPSRQNNARGLLLYGIVQTTYEVDSPELLSAPNATIKRKQIYCDVMCLSSISGYHLKRLERCRVLQPNASIQSGRVWKPRPTTRNLDPKGLDFASDGDHVVIGFLDDAFNIPLILGAVTHPLADTGLDPTTLPGQRLLLTKTDGDVDFCKHQGAFYGLDTDGSMIIDLTRAFSAPLQQDLSEPLNPGDGTTGNVKIRLAAMSKVTVEIAGGPSITIENSGANAKLTLGDGAKHVAIVEHLQQLYGELKTAYDQVMTLLTSHVHPVTAISTPTGVSVSLATLNPAPSWKDAINSSKMSLPDG